MQHFNNKLEKYIDSKKSFFFASFFGNDFLAHRTLFKKIFNPVTIPFVLCILTFAIFFQEGIFLVSFYLSIIAIMLLIGFVIFSSIIDLLFSVKIIKYIVIILSAIFIFNIIFVMTGGHLIEKMLFMTRIYEIAFFISCSYILYKLFLFIMPSLNNGIFSFIKATIDIENILNIYYIVIILTDVFYLMLSLILHNLYFLDIMTRMIFVVLMNLIMVSIVHAFSDFVNAELSDDNRRFFKYYEDNFDTISDEKKDEFLKICVDKSNIFREVELLILILIGLKILFVFYFM
jgi:hypothetical protein